MKPLISLKEKQVCQLWKPKKGLLRQWKEGIPNKPSKTMIWKKKNRKNLKSRLTMVLA